MLSVYDSTFTIVYFTVLAFILGACMGSFLNCTAIRIGRGESFVKGSSHCMSCGHDLSWKDLIPILSWVMLKGKCRYCGAKVSARYPIVEVLFGLISVACVLKFDLTVLCLRNYIFLMVLYLLALTDIDTMEIPDSCHVIMIAVWAATAYWIYPVPEIISHIAAAFVFGGGVLVISLIMDHVLKRDSLGGGDIKLLFVVGLYFGFVGTLLVLILSCILGLIFNTIIMKKNDDSENNAFPFGPWIAAASAIVLFAGDPVIEWYISLIG